MNLRSTVRQSLQPSVVGARVAAAIFAMVVAFGGPLGAELLIFPGDTAEATAARERLAAAPRPSTVPSPQALDGPGTTLFLPYFEVDAAGFTDTTLIGIRNVSANASASIDVAYLDVFGTTITVEADVVIPPSGVYTRNIRDVPGLPADPDGVKRGMVVVISNRTVSGDFFNVDPTNDFATGGRMVADGERCTSWDVRFAVGGAFSGGTRFQLYADTPRGTGAGDPATVSLLILDEGGTIFGTVSLKTDQNVTDFDIADILAALPGGVGPSLGSAFVFFNNSADTGLLQAEYSAEGRYSIGLPASCQTTP